jgi:WhiB family redox-sensing transcriptional regulator
MTLVETAPAPMDSAELAPLGDMAKVMDYVGSHPGKLVTVLALSTFPPEKYVTSPELVRRMNAIQGDTPGWDFTASYTTPFSYCKRSLDKAGLVEFTTQPSVQKGKTTEAVRLNAFGRLGGMIAAGALLPLELAALELGGDQSLQEAMGAAQQQRARSGGDPSRLVIYRELLGTPSGALAISELGRRTGLGPGTIVATIQELCRTGVLERSDRSEPASRTFTLDQPPNISDNYLRLMNEGTRAAIAAASELYRQGRTTVNGAELLQAASVLQPDIDTRKVWEMLLAWVRGQDRGRSESFIVENQLTDDRRIRTQVRVSEPWQPFLTQLLKIRGLLTSDEPEAVAFRAEALTRAEQLAGARQLLAQVLAKAQGTSHFVPAQSDEDWTVSIRQHIPTEGITTTQLHEVVTTILGRQVSYQKFRRRLGSLAWLTITERPGIGRASAPLGYVTRRAHRFRADWEAEALCRGGQEDPELFFPPGTEGASVEQAEKAKRVCRGCPVQLACLKTAIDRGEGFGVWGGIWMEKRAAELTAVERDWLDTTVSFAPGVRKKTV